MWLFDFLKKNKKEEIIEQSKGIVSPKKKLKKIKRIFR